MSGNKLNCAETSRKKNGVGAATTAVQMDRSLWGSVDLIVSETTHTTNSRGRAQGGCNEENGACV
jgi:hypothetical protein